MNKEFENISEAVLFDNLKRSANKWLRKLNDEKDPLKKLDFFNGKYPETIQLLLKDIGRHLFRIFLFESIKKIVNIKGLSHSQKQEKLNTRIKKFRFYFYPGYTTQLGERIFLLGNTKNSTTDDRFFTGIGNTILDDCKMNRLIKYLLNEKVSPGFCFKYKDNFWVDDIPSTIALDNSLNQFYIDKYIGKNLFKVPSTHYWKSSQRRPDDSYLPMPISDESEFRILKISIGSKKNTNCNNQISIFINKNDLLQSGQRIQDVLNKHINRMGKINPKDKDHYIPWPFGNEYHSLIKGRIDLQTISLNAYSYWLSETLNLRNGHSINYKAIREEFNKNNLEELSKRIVPFKAFLKNVEDPSQFNELYYNHWYTLFLESYGKDVDLGTVMLLTSEEYSPEFLMKCTNWIRWIYNELRLIEATTNEIIEAKAETQEQDFKNIKHHLNALVTANNYFIKQNKDTILTREDVEILSFISSNMSAFINLNDSLNNGNVIEINVRKEIDFTKKVFSLCAVDNHAFSKVFRRYIHKRYFGKHKNLNYLKIEGDSPVITASIDTFKLLIKDLIENLVKHSDLEIPDCRIRIEDDTDSVNIYFLNSNWPELHDLEKMKNNSFGVEKTGWRNIKLCVESNSWDMQIPKDLEDKFEGSFFWIKIKIRKM
jgi:hypothetical protein